MVELRCCVGAAPSAWLSARSRVRAPTRSLRPSLRLVCASVWPWSSSAASLCWWPPALGRSSLRSDLLPGEPVYVPWLVFGGHRAAGRRASSRSTSWSGRKRLDTITAVYFGLIIGLFLTYILKIAFGTTLEPDSPYTHVGRSLILGMVLCYTCISILMQTKDDFRFIIPYVEFAKEIKGLKPYVLDTSVVIDGRIADVVETRIIDNQLIMPQFVIAELQAIADSSDKLRRGRGRRGLDILNRLRSDPKVDLVVFDRELPQFAGQPVDQKLVLLAKHLDGKVVTNDYNLNKVAKLHNVGVINLNDLSQRPQADLPAGRDAGSADHEAGRRAGPGRRLPRRRHDGRHRRRPRARRAERGRHGHQRAADQRGPDGLRPVRARGADERRGVSDA